MLVPLLVVRQFMGIPKLIPTPDPFQPLSSSNTAASSNSCTYPNMHPPTVAHKFLQIPTENLITAMFKIQSRKKTLLEFHQLSQLNPSYIRSPIPHSHKSLPPSTETPNNCTPIRSLYTKHQHLQFLSISDLRIGALHSFISYI